MLKQHLNDVIIVDIQLSRAGIFTLYASDVKSFNRLLNEFTSILAANGHPSAKIYVPRSIQRIKDTETVAFVKRVDLELPTDRITEALKHVGLDVTDVIRLNSKDGNNPTRTIKITFKDASNRNTFVHTGLQVDSMHFNAEAASHNTKPVQCYICLKYNHVAKYCKTKQQVCSRCGEDHRMDQCTVANDGIKCCNCKGNHLATSNDCSHYKEQEKRMLNMVNQYSSANKPTATAPSPHNINEFPSLPNTSHQLQMEQRQNDFFDNLINVLTSRMEMIIEEATSRIFKTLQKKLNKIEKSIGNNNNINDKDDENINDSENKNIISNNTDNDKNNNNSNSNINKDDAALTVSDSDSNEEDTVVKHIRNKQKQKAEATKLTTPVSKALAGRTTTTSTLTTSKNSNKPNTNASKRPLSPNSSLDTSTNDSKDAKTNTNDD